jgi:protein-disulfide isomerase
MDKTNSGPRHNLTLALAVLIAGGLIAFALGWGLDRIAGEVRSAASAARAPSSPVVAEAPAVVDFANVSLDGPFIGDPAAPVGMAYWFDYQCPFCRQVENEVMPQLIKTYVDTGKLRIYFKDFQFLGSDSFEAAIASRAVWEAAPQLFGTWHTALFKKQDRENGGWGNRADIIALLSTIQGLDAKKVELLMQTKADEYLASIDRNLQEGGRFGIQGTPGTVIGKQLLSGAQSFENFQAAVEEALASAASGSRPTS